MKKELFIAVLLMTGLGTVSAETKEISKSSMLAELQTSCIGNGNSESSCKCAINAFDTGLTEDEWGTLLTLADEKKKVPDLEAVKTLQAKVQSMATKCGADK